MHLRSGVGGVPGAVRDPVGTAAGTASVVVPRPDSEGQAALAPPAGKGGRDPGDINGDGFADLVFLIPHDHWSPDLAIVYGSRRGLNPATRTMVASTHVEFTTGTSTADLDGDGFADILAHGRPAKALRKPNAPYILWGGPKGVDPRAEPTPWRTPSPPSPSWTGDFDGDGDADLAIPVGATNDSSTLATELALFHGPFTRTGSARRHDMRPSPDGEPPRSLIAGRIGRHRATDLFEHASGIEGQHATWLLRGGPAGLSHTPRTLNEGGAVALGDFDGDGRDELALAWFSSASVEGWDQGLSVWWVTDGTRDETFFGTGAW
ncbi:FG-GAP repeat domain-containing protein [Streptosporangium sp. DT93]|uniref:FG-GAP repeat domain-containing protein n=1 Tax=Streptosporangium sp. DT93 TaxID=3393428 RepID=UPI003CF1ADAE